MPTCTQITDALNTLAQATTDPKVLVDLTGKTSSIVEKNRLIDMQHTEILKAHAGLTSLQQRAEGDVHTYITNLLADLKKHL